MYPVLKAYRERLVKINTPQDEFQHAFQKRSIHSRDHQASEVSLMQATSVASLTMTLVNN